MFAEPGDERKRSEAGDKYCQASMNFFFCWEKVHGNRRERKQNWRQQTMNDTQNRGPHAEPVSP
jgi:hypothetical protein